MGETTMNTGTREQDAPTANGHLYSREDWTSFRNLGTISQRSGVPPERLRRLVAKELADNALDVSNGCEVGELAGGGFFVQDNGPGVSAGPESLARLYSIRRPLLSSKIKRLPTRGALGNGLRVVAGAVLASRGSLAVETGGQRFLLVPQESGETSVRREGAGRKRGTRIEVHLGESVPDDDEDCLLWARQAIEAAGDAPVYAGKTSPFWYDSDSFFELVQAAGTRPMRSVIADFDGCSGKRAGQIAAEFLSRPASSLSREETERILRAARQDTRPVKPKRLRRLGRGVFSQHYGADSGLIRLPPGQGTICANVPFTVEAWVSRPDDPDDEEDRITVLVNRTPVTGQVDIERAREKTKVTIFGCNLGYEFKVGKRPVAIVLNVQAPHMPTTSEGKEPNLRMFVQAIGRAIVKAAKSCQRANPERKGNKTQKDLILEMLPQAIHHVSGGGQYRYGERNLFYGVAEALGRIGAERPGWDWFCKVVTQYEHERGDLPGMTRDDRGVIYHPHLGIEIPLGTVSVEQYQRPEWTFNKALYCEKEGLFEVLKSARWPERHDCALLTSKGFATRAARDLLDFLGDTEEELRFFCIHDADAYGSCIYQALTDGTLARPARRVNIINLGLEPWQGVEMGLTVEPVKKEKGRRPVGGYVRERSGNWEGWLQTKRIELNAMTSPQFIGWLDASMERHGNGKLVPPSAVMQEHLTARVRELAAAAIRERILADAGFRGRVDQAMRVLGSAIERDGKRTCKGMPGWLAENQDRSWRASIDQFAAEIVRRQGGEGEF